jgi:hypothetical protein
MVIVCNIRSIEKGLEAYPIHAYWHMQVDKMCGSEQALSDIKHFRDLGYFRGLQQWRREMTGGAQVNEIYADANVMSQMAYSAKFSRRGRSSFSYPPKSSSIAKNAVRLSQEQDKEAPPDQKFALDDRIVHQMPSTRWRLSPLSVNAAHASILSVDTPLTHQA